jgi:hypothetical protein
VPGVTEVSYPLKLPALVEWNKKNKSSGRVRRACENGSSDHHSPLALRARRGGTAQAVTNPAKEGSAPRSAASAGLLPRLAPRRDPTIRPNHFQSEAISALSRPHGVCFVSGPAHSLRDRLTGRKPRPIVIPRLKAGSRVRRQLKERPLMAGELSATFWLLSRQSPASLQPLQSADLGDLSGRDSTVRSVTLCCPAGTAGDGCKSASARATVARSTAKQDRLCVWLTPCASFTQPEHRVASAGDQLGS